MIQVKVSDGKTECVVDGEPAIIAAELTAIESAVYEQVGKRSMVDLIAVWIIRNNITQAIANNAHEKARYTPTCEYRNDDKTCSLHSDEEVLEYCVYGPCKDENAQR